MSLQRYMFIALAIIFGIIGAEVCILEGRPHRIILDTDVDTDDVFALLYLLKLNRSLFDLQAVTINANMWTDAGHSVNLIYDVLFMMGRDDIAVGVGGDGGILEDGTILPNVGGYLPIIGQGIGTAGYCRYRQAISVGSGGRLKSDTNFGIRKELLPQGGRKYSPLKQHTAQQVMIEKISAGPTNVFLIGAHTNFAIFLMSNPDLKKNVEHIYIMGGGVRSSNPTGCCPENASSCQPQQCGDHGNIFTDYTSNPYAEFNFFGDPFAAYQVIHSGIPITLVPLDATNTIPITEKFLEEFEKNQHTFEAQYCIKSLKMAHDTWSDDQFFTSYFMWDSFTIGIATSIMSKSNNDHGENEFAEMEYMNITVVTSNEPYGISDGSNPFFDGVEYPKFKLKRNGVHSGHVQTSLRDPFCLVENRKGKCKDGFTAEVTGPEAVQVLVATKAKPNQDPTNILNREFFTSFLDVLNNPRQTGKFNFTTQFPFYNEGLYKPDFRGEKLGKNLIFDMDMSPGDFLALFYLLKVPVNVINLKAILVTPTGWANAATIDVVYDLLHMMGRDDIPVGLGDVFALNQSDTIFPAVGDCKYVKAIPQGSGGFLDSDTLYGFGRDLPRSPRRYIELRQQQALETWEEVAKSLDPGAKVTILTNGPLTTLAKIVLSGKNMTSFVQDVFIVGGHINYNPTEKGNVINVSLNEHAEFNLFLDPLAAKITFDSELDITVVPLVTQRKVSTFVEILERLTNKKTPEALFAKCLLSTLHELQRIHPSYQHMDMFLGEMLGAVIVGVTEGSKLKPTYNVERIKVSASGDESHDGEIIIDNQQGKSVKVLESVDPSAYYDLFANRLGDKQSTVASMEGHRRIWNMPSGGNKSSSY